MNDFSRRDGDVVIVDLGAGDNRFTPEVLAALSDVLDDLEQSDGPRALVVAGRGKVWSNGLDTDRLATWPHDEAMAYVAGVHRLLARVLVLGAPTVAAMTGHAFGAGALFALCHDVRVMRADRGWWCLPEVDLGMSFSPGFLSVAISRLLPDVANEAITTGRRYAAPDALAASIVSAIHDEDDVVAAAVEVAAARAPKAGPALATLKGDLYSTPARLLHEFGA